MPKLRYILFPLMVGSLLFVALLGGARWLVDLTLQAGHITREIWDFWLPLTLAAGLIFGVLRSRWHLLDRAPQLDAHPDRKTRWSEAYRQAQQRQNRDERLRTFLHWSAFICIAVMLIGSQNYLTALGSRLVGVSSLSQIGFPKPDLCLRLPSNVQLSVEHAGMLPELREIPRHYSMPDTELNIYCAVPLTDNDSLQNSSDFTYWYVKKYTQRLPVGSDVQRAGEELYQKVSDDLHSGALMNFNYLRVAPYSQDYHAMQEAVQNARGTITPHNIVILTPETKLFHRSKAGLWWALGAWGCVLCIVGAVCIATPAIAEEKLTGFLARRRRPWRTKISRDAMLAAWRSVPVPMTCILVALNCLGWLWMLTRGIDPFSPSAEELFRTGGVTVASVIDDGQWWRILTAMFAHSGLFHLLGNMFVLCITGWFVEGTIKQWQYLLTYFVAGFGAFALSIFFTDPDTVMIGASGAIFGLLGVELVVYLRNPKRKDLLWTFVSTGGFSLLMGLMPGVSNAAHIGGLAVGLLLGLWFVHRRRRRKRSGRARR